MRLPFLQISQEEIARARTLAGYLGVSWQHAVGMATALKAAALEVAPEGDVSGTIRDEHPDEWIAVQVGFPVEHAAKVTGAMLRCGFVMAGPSPGYAVAGLEPYRAALDTASKRSEAGKKGASKRWGKPGYGAAMAQPSQSHGHGMASDAQTQTQTQTQTKEDPPNPPGGERASTSFTPPRTASALPSEPHPFEAEHEQEESLQEGLSRVHQEVRGAPYAWGSADEKASRQVLALAGAGGVAEILRRFRNGLAAREYARRINGLSDFLKPNRWNANAAAEAQGPPGKAPCREINQNDYREGPVDRL